MPVVVIYLIKIIVSSAVLFGYYWLALRNKIYHQYNRFYLLASVVISLVIPFAEFNFIHYSDEAANNTIRLLKVVSSGNEYLDEIIVSSKQRALDGTELALLAYVLVSIVLLGAMLNAVVHIIKLYKANSHETIQNIRVINTTAKGTPFSFFNFIFWNTHIDMHSDAGKQVLQHEMIHVKEKHSLDKLFINTVIAILWINPFFWLIRKELNMIHEFIADKKALEDGDTAKLAQMILQATYPQQNFSITNHFFYSPIKRRLAMITKNHNTKAGYIARVLALPLLVLIVSAFTVKMKIFTKMPAAGYDGDAITVVIDAGHGGKDFGAEFNGKYEKDITLSIVKKIKELNTNDKIKVILSRENDDPFISPSERVEFSKNNKADCFISVHLDIKNPDNPVTSGLTVYVAKDQFANVEKSRILASAVINQFMGNYALSVSPNPIQRQKGIWVLQANECPSVLIEAGFLDNKKDLAFLLSKEGQKSIAMNILAAIEKYAANRNNTEAINQLPVTSLKEINFKAEKIIQGGNQVTGSAEGKINVTDASKILVIVDGKKMNNQSMQNVTIKAKAAIIYSENNKEAVKQYGTEAANGLIIFKNASIKKNEADAKGIFINVEEATLIGSDNFTYNVQRPSGIINASEKNPTIKKDMFGRPVLIKEDKAENNMVHINDTNKLKPLYIVDGIPKDEKAIKEIAPENIESINVLKNESATAIYGPKAKDGVIMIVTKKVKAETAANAQATNLSPEALFTEVETEAAFPGEQDGWRNYLMKKLDGSVPAKEGWKKGSYKILIQFVVEKDGTVNRIKTVNYEGSKTAEHCINLIKNGPKWSPAQQNGQTVSSIKKQPITFVVE